jgi:hypothetical protein
MDLRGEPLTTTDVADIAHLRVKRLASIPR